MDSDNSSMSSRSSSPELDVFIGASPDLRGLSSRVSSTTSRGGPAAPYQAGTPAKPRTDHHLGRSSTTTSSSNANASAATTGSSSSSTSSSSLSMTKSKGTGGGGGGGGGGSSRSRLSKEDLEALQDQGEPCGQELRLKINSRERKRMQDLNVAMDGLREVMPYAHGPSVRKLSKIATLLLARNYILMLNGSLDEMKRLLGDIYGGGGGGGGAAAAAAAATAGAPGGAAGAGHNHHRHHHSAFHACAPVANHHHQLHHHAALTSSLAAGVAAGLAAAPGPSGAARHSHGPLNHHHQHHQHHHHQQQQQQQLKAAAVAPHCSFGSVFQQWGGLACACAMCLQMPAHVLAPRIPSDGK